MIQFNEIEVEGFRSLVLPVQFNLNKPGLTLIKGVNGAGKTSIFEALVWGLFGTNLKDTNMDALVTWPENRPSSFAGTHVGVSFQIGDSTFYVSRNMKYKKEVLGVKGEDYLFLAKNGVMVGDFRNKSEVQSEIERILGVGVKTFMNSIIFAQRAMKLIQQDNKDKRELFETIFETEWVSQCKTRCDEDLKTWDSDLLKLGWNINKSSTEIEHLTDKLSTAKLVISNFEGHRTAKRVNKEVEQKQYTTKLAELETELVTYQDQFTNIKYDAAAHDALNEQFEALDKQFNESRLTEVTYSGKLTSAQNLIESKKAEYLRVSTEHLKLVDKHIKGNCPYCEQELKTGNKLEVNHNKDIASAFEKVGIVSMAVKEAEKALKALQKLKAPVTPESITKEKEAIEEQLIAMDELFTTHQDTAESIKNINNELIQAKKDLLRANNELIVIAAEKPPVVDIKNIELNILQEQDKLKGLEDEKPKIEKKIEIAKWWSSKGFSSGGIKAYIFTAMLTQLNQNVKKYGDRLGASLEFSIDLTKASKPFTTVCSLGDKLNKDYKDFSGGEKQKLDIALTFAMHDLISMNTDMNILIMDECFEGLSEDGETAVFDLIRSKAEEGKSIYIITHSAVLDSLYANTIQFENKQGNTLILN